MAVYRCPRCDQLVKKDAKQCNRCGLFFDVNNEPVADEGIELSEDEKRKLIVFLIVAGIVITIELKNDSRMVSCVVPDCSTAA